LSGRAPAFTFKKKHLQEKGSTRERRSHIEEDWINKCMLFNEGKEQERPLLWYIIMKKKTGKRTHTSQMEEKKERKTRGKGDRKKR
jgi:hypothetical protein